jgi:DNA-binding NarL/FixJ family response regulator
VTAIAVSGRHGHDPNDVMPPASPRVVVAHGHEAARIGLRLALQQEGCAVSASARDVDSVVVAALRERPDVCLVDVLLPGGGGVVATHEIKAAAPGVRVVLLSGPGSDDLVLAALSAGADGSLPKDVEASRLAIALRAVADGETVLPGRLVALLVASYSDARSRGDRSLVGRLTEREREVVEILLEDVGTGEVAYRLGVKAVTVRRHISGIVRKSGMATRAGAIGRVREERDAASALAGVQARLNTNRC